MKKTITSTIAISFLLIGFSGCASPDDQSTDQPVMSNQFQSENYEISAISAHEKLENNKSVKLIDVRTPKEYDEKHLPDSTLVPLDTLNTGIAEIENLNKSDEIIVYCRSGRKSAKAYNILTLLGYTNVKSMTGGINEWTSLGYNVCLGTSLTC